MTFRIGIDFGYKFSGIVLATHENAVLDYRTVEHRTDLSDTMTNRRQLRASRRRNKAKRRRLRDFYALLKGMDLEPVNSRPGEVMTFADRMRLGNRLYALAHHRGWDYAELSEQLVVCAPDNNKSPELPSVVKEIDHLLLQQYNAPAKYAPKKSKKKKEQSDNDHKSAQQQAQNALTRRDRNGTQLPEAHLRFIELQTPFLGELHRIEQALYKYDKKASLTAAEEQEYEQLQNDRERIYGYLDNSNKDNIEQWLRERLKAVYGGKTPPESDEIIKQVLVKLGLETATELFQQRKTYRPHRNRHRDEMLKDSQTLIKHACGEDDGGDSLFSQHHHILTNKCKPQNAPQLEAMRACWQEDIKRVRRQAEAIAEKRSASENRALTAPDVIARWVSSAEKIIQHAYRKKRFENRKVGKCPARCNDKRCGNNLPRKNRTDIRRLQFLIEARQMKIITGKSKKNQQISKMIEPEITALLAKLRLNEDSKKISREDMAHNREVIKNEIKTPPVKNDARGKQDSLSDIVGGEQNGRAGLCKEHLQEKLVLLERGAEDTAAWQNLHQERILTMEDAPPSIRQKVGRVIVELRRMLQAHEIRYADISHIGLETARFDISALAQNEGKKMPASQYQKSRSPIDRIGLAREQDGLCILCGEQMRGGNIHADHLFPRTRGGSNMRLNMVAMHDYCNINKSNRDLSINAQALEALLRNNPHKGEAVQNGKNRALSRLEAPQHTMFGAKILKGSLMKVLHISHANAGKIIRRPRATDIAFMRKQWFPFMDKQKSALRAKNPNLKITAGASGDSAEVNIDTFKLSSYLFDKQDLSIDGGGGLVQLIDGKLRVSTQTSDAGVRGFFICADNERVELTAHADDDAIQLPKKNLVIKGEIGAALEIKLHDICPSEWRTLTPRVHSDWLALSGNTLRGAPVWTKKGHKQYVVWPQISFSDNAGAEHGRVTLRVQTAKKRLSLAILPPQTDGIHVFHHALDAAIMAANIDWNAIIRMSRDAEQRTWHDRKKMQQFATTGKLDFSGCKSKLQLPQTERGDYTAPPGTELYYVKDALQQGKLSTQKFDTEPLRLRDGELSQRVPLPNIAEQDIPHIISKPIRTAMKSLWQEINTREEENKKQAMTAVGGKKYILQSYFLQLPKDHLLHPHQTRAARCRRMAGNSPDLFEPLTGEPNKHDQRKNKQHYFRRAEGWARAEVYENEGRKTAHRVKNHFYWSKKDEPEFDRPPPEGARLVACYRRGDKVTAKGLEGVWSIKKLGTSAVLQPQCAQSRAVANERNCTYHKLSKY